MPTDTTTYSLRVQRRDPLNDLPIDIGTLSFGPNGQLAVVGARANYEEYLTGIVASVNAKPQLSIKVPPPPGGRGDGVYFMTVSRTAPDLRDMMRQFLEQKFDLLLEDAFP